MTGVIIHSMVVVVVVAVAVMLVVLILVTLVRVLVIELELVSETLVDSASGRLSSAEPEGAVSVVVAVGVGGSVPAFASPGGVPLSGCCCTSTC